MCVLLTPDTEIVSNRDVYVGDIMLQNFKNKSLYLLKKQKDLCSLQRLIEVSYVCLRHRPPILYWRIPWGAPWWSRSHSNSRLFWLLTFWSAKQRLVALPSTDAEVYAVVEGTTYVIWICVFLSKLGFELEGPIPIHQDNKLAMIIYHNGGQFRSIYW
jgi:hypothetical protein